MAKILYDANPPVFRNNPVVFIVCVAALVFAGLVVSEVPQLLLLVLAVCLLVWLFLFVISKTRRLTITDGEVRFEQGLLSKKRSELSLSSVRSLRIDQTFFQRILGVASVEFYSAGDVPEISVKGLPDPHAIREIVDG